MPRAASLFMLILVLHPGPLEAVPRPARAVPSRLAGIDSLRHFDANQLDLATTNLGSLGFDLPTFDGGLEYPRGSGRKVVFAAGLWVGARVAGVPRVTVADYSSEWRPGRMFGVVPEPPIAPYLRNWKMRPAGAWRSDVDSGRVFVAGGRDPLLHESWLDYVAAQPMTDAPIRDVRLPHPDAPGESVWVTGPDLPGEQALWATFNDGDPEAHDNNAGSTPPLGIEVRQTVFGFEQTPGSVAFVRWKLFHRGEAPLDSAYVTFWVDADVGGAVDDLVGWDPDRQMGYAYNATNADATYGARPPAVGVRLLSGPAGAQAGAFNGSFGGSDPDTASVTYGLMRGLQFDGSEWIDPATLLPSRFPFAGDPVTGTGWLDTSPSDRRFLVSAGPFDLAIGDSAEFVFAIVVGGGLDRLDSIGRLRCQADLAKDAADAGFAPLFPAGLALSEATARADEVDIAWTAGGVSPRPLDVRRHPGPIVVPWPETSEWRDQVNVNGAGRITLVDPPLPGGEEWTYGLFDPCSPLEPLSQVALAGPGGALSFRVLSPISGGTLVFSLQLPGNGHVRLEAYSVDGRRLFDRDLGFLDQGPQTALVPIDPHWPSGLYFLRVTQGAVARTGRIVLVR